MAPPLLGAAAISRSSSTIAGKHVWVYTSGFRNLSGEQCYLYPVFLLCPAAAACRITLT